MELFTSVGDVIIFIGAIVAAIVGIYRFFTGIGKGVKNKVDESREQQEADFNARVDARIKLTTQPMLDQTAKTLTASFEGLLDKYLPARLVEHDLETRRKYLEDRQRYLTEIRDEVVLIMQDKIKAVNEHGDQMKVFSEVLKELLRERIMEIYRRNRRIRQLEDHERFELRKAYEAYKSIGGNSYIDEYYAAMEQWESVPDNTTTE